MPFTAVEVIEACFLTSRLSSSGAVIEVEAEVTRPASNLRKELRLS